MKNDNNKDIINILHLFVIPSFCWRNSNSSSFHSGNKLVTTWPAPLNRLSWWTKIGSAGMEGVVRWVPLTTWMDFVGSWAAVVVVGFVVVPDDKDKVVESTITCAAESGMDKASGEDNMRE